MIAEAMVVSGLGPDAFGVEPSAALGAEVMAVLYERQKANDEEPDPYAVARAEAEELRRQHG